ncbi:MAG TPA: glutathione synthase [Stellaceae bacterium]|jgi:glutathione synthase|nr:glutathione synthase [Stellaceae bacterium]
MGLAVAIQMDPIDTINIDADSTFALALEAQARGHALYHYLPQALTLRDGRLYARGRPLEVFRQYGNHHKFGEFTELDLAGLDIVLMRQDPPFDMAYITATHLLELLPEGGPLVVNDPASVRNAPEKLFVLRFKELMPPTLLSLDPAEIRAFWDEHKDIILKPLFGNGGAGIFRLRPGDENLNSLLEMYALVHREPVMVQRYVPEVRQGDKRIILVEGEPIGAVSRVPAEGESRANLHVGGRAEKTVLTEREREICAAIGPTLRAQGLVFVGIDVIGDYMTEINVTSPTGIQEIGRLDGVDLAPKVWDAIETRYAARSDRRPA